LSATQSMIVEPPWTRDAASRLSAATWERTHGFTHTTSPGRASRHTNPETQECGPDPPLGSTRETAAALSEAAWSR
jgi:hypothetical protein